MSRKRRAACESRVSYLTIELGMERSHPENVAIPRRHPLDIPSPAFDLDLDQYRAIRRWLAGTKPPCLGRVWRRAPLPCDQDDMTCFQPMVWGEQALFYILVALMVCASLCSLLGVFVYVWVLAHRHPWILVMATGVGLGIGCLLYGCVCCRVTWALGYGALWFILVMASAGIWVGI